MAQCRAMNYAWAMHCGTALATPLPFPTPHTPFSLFILTWGTHPQSIAQAHTHTHNECTIKLPKHMGTLIHTRRAWVERQFLAPKSAIQAVAGTSPSCQSNDSSVILRASVPFGDVHFPFIRVSFLFFIHMLHRCWGQWLVGWRKNTLVCVFVTPTVLQRVFFFLMLLGVRVRHR